MQDDILTPLLHTHIQYTYTNTFRYAYACTFFTYAYT